MSKYLFILALIPSALAAVSNTLPWSICHDTNAFSIHNVEITYDRDTRLLWAYGEGTASAEVSTGKVKTNLEIFGFEYFEEKTDICVAVDCPLKPGKFVFNKNVTIPINFPLLDWAPKFEFETTDGQPLFCVSSHLSLAYPILNYVLIYASLFVAVSSGFTTLMTRYLRHGYNMTLYDMSSGWAPTARLLPSRIYPGFVDVAMFAQFVAFTGMFTMEYPHAYQDFTRYFVWAVGTWNTAFIASIAKTIRAGGWHFLEFKTRLAQGRSGLMTLHKRVVAPTAIVEEGAVNGFQRYASIIDLNERDVFLHTLIAFVICLILISVGCFGVAVVRSVRRARAPRPTIDDISVRSLHHQHHHIRHYYLGWVVRTLMLFYFGLTSTSLYQLTLSDEPPVVYALAGIVFSVLGLILPAAMTARLIGIARMNRTLDVEDPEIAEQVYVKSVKDNILDFKDQMAHLRGSSVYSKSTLMDDDVTEVMNRMRSMSCSEDDRLTASADGASSTLRSQRLRAFSVSTRRTDTTSSSRSASWPLPPLYLSQKFMLAYGPFFNQYDPSHYIAHAEFLIVLTWWLRMAPAFAIGILGKIAPPYLQFIVGISGDAVMFFYLWWKSPFNGKPVNRWQRFLYFARCGFIVTMFFGYLLKKFDWILQLICYGLILSTLGIHGLFLATSGLRFTTAALRGFKKHTGPPVPVSTDFVHSDHRNVPDVPALPTNVTFSPPARKPFKAESTVSRPQTRTNKEGPSQNPPVDITSRSPASISVTVGDDFVEDVEDIGNPYLRELPK